MVIKYFNNKFVYRLNLNLNLKLNYSWVPAYFTINYETYANQVCWVSNTYYTNQTQNLPKSEEVRKQSEIKYYQWIPVIR